MNGAARWFVLFYFVGIGFCSNPQEGMGSSQIFNHVGAPPCVAPKFYDSLTEIEE